MQHLTVWADMVLPIELHDYEVPRTKSHIGANLSGSSSQSCIKSFLSCAELTYIQSW